VKVIDPVVSVCVTLVCVVVWSDEVEVSVAVDVRVVV
jgi:hypothetical protein